MLTIILTLLLWLVLNSIAQADLKPVQQVATPKKRRGKGYDPEMVLAIDLLALLENSPPLL